MSTYKSLFKLNKPQHKTMMKWAENSIDTLKGFLSTDWSIFYDLELEEATTTISDCTNFCVENVVEKKRKSCISQTSRLTYTNTVRDTFIPFQNAMEDIIC